MKPSFDIVTLPRGVFLLLVGFLVSAPVVAAGPGKTAIDTASHFATDVGFDVIAKGGNAFDAAIAVSATLSVVEPQSGIGSGGFFLLHGASDGGKIMIDERSAETMGLHEHGQLGRGQQYDARPVRSALAGRHRQVQMAALKRSSQR